jgi:hypothetical protein
VWPLADLRLRKIEPVTFDPVDGSDMDSVGSDDFHTLFD